MSSHGLTTPSLVAGRPAPPPQCILNSRCLLVPVTSEPIPLSFLMRPCHLSHLALILPDNKSIRIQVLEDCFEYKCITEACVSLCYCLHCCRFKSSCFDMTHFFLSRRFSHSHKNEKKNKEKLDVRLFFYQQLHIEEKNAINSCLSTD